jgi:hypothetical protein
MRWWVRGEFEAGLIVLILLMMVYVSGIGGIPSLIPLPGGFGFLPGLGQDPNAEGLFPSGFPGVTPGEAEQLGIGEGDGDNKTGDSGMTPQELGEISDVLSEMGESLENNASTSELGQALQQGDFDKAADEISSLAENLDDLSEITKQNLSESFQNAADRLQQPGQQDLADALRNASGAIQAEDDINAGEKLDVLASQINALGSQFSEEQIDDNNEEEIGISQPETGGTESFERIQGEGEIFDLSDFGDQTSLLNPAESLSEENDQLVGGQYDYTLPADGTLIEGVINTYNLSWDKTNVVTAYFSP